MKTRFFILYFFIQFTVLSQNLNNFHEVFLSEKSDNFLGVFFVEPESLILYSNNQVVSDSDYVFNPQTNKIDILDTNLTNLRVTFRTINIEFQKKYYKRDSSLIVPKYRKSKSINNNLAVLTDEVFNVDELDKQGKLGRSISVGNNQDPVLNSELDLQINGKITNDLYLEAKISDESRPIQPDGNTAKIQDFNHIFMRVYNKKTQLIAGDFINEQPNSYFLKYQKQLQGIQYITTNLAINKIGQIEKTVLGFALARGKYNRQIIKSIEGNQGPYKLQGANGETFITVIAESEKVFLNDKRLSRGGESDYVIDYNSAEITFGVKNNITKDSRIIIEFEYTERQYSKFTIYTNNEIKAKNTTFLVNYYNEQDAKNQTLDFELLDEHKLLLLNIGDSLDDAYIISAYKTDFDPKKTLYKKNDTMIDNISYVLFEYSTLPIIDLYDVSFSYVGTNNGNYIIDSQLSNGRIYKWVKPQNGIHQGDYEPQRKIITPKKKQVFDFGVKHQFNNKNLLDIDFSISENDVNLFSNKDDKDNLGKAVRTSFLHFFSGNDTLVNKTLLLVDYEFVEKTFSPIEIYKNQEFDRDWNISKLYHSNQHFINLGFQSFVNNNFFKIKTAGLAFDKQYIASNTTLESALNFKSNLINLMSSYLFSDDYKNTTNYSKSKISYSKKINKLLFFSDFEFERNIWKSLSYDSILENSQMFYDFKVGIKNTDTTRINFLLDYSRRWDFLPKDNLLKMTTFSNNLNFESNFRFKKIFVNSVIKYRQLFDYYAIGNNKSQDFLLSKVSSNISFLKDILEYTVQIILSNGMEQKNQYIFVEVEAGKGLYIWNDYNEDELKQIDEFEISYFSDEAKYVKVSVQSNLYIKVYQKSLSQSLVFLPAEMFSQKTFFHKILSGFKNSISFNVDYKSYSFNLFNFSDTNSVSFNYSFINNLDYHISKKIIFTYGLQKNSSKVLIVNGNDFRKIATNKFGLNYVLNRHFSVFNEFYDSKNYYMSNYSMMKNYVIFEKVYTLKFSYVIDFFNISIKYSYKDKLNKAGLEKLFVNNLGILIDYKISKKISLLTDFELIDNIFLGDANSNVAYMMLEGLKPTFNSVWQLNFKINLTKSMLLTFVYSGRFSNVTKIIHNGGINIVAYF